MATTHSFSCIFYEITLDLISVFFYLQNEILICKSQKKIAYCIIFYLVSISYIFRYKSHICKICSQKYRENTKLYDANKYVKMPDLISSKCIRGLLFFQWVMALGVFYEFRYNSFAWNGRDKWDHVLLFMGSFYISLYHNASLSLLRDNKVKYSMTNRFSGI